MARLGNFIEQIRGVSYKPEDVCSANDSDAIAILRANNIQDDGLNFDDLVFVKKSKVSNTQLLRKGDIVVCASSGSKNLVGKAAIAKENMEMSFGAFCKVVRVKAITAEYLGHYFQSPAYRNLISDLASGANINNIRNEHIDELDLPVPEKEIQEEISVQLDKICDLISNRKEQLEKLDLLVKSRFVELFGDVITNSKNWDVMTWNTVLTIKNGRNQKQVENPTGKYPICGSGGVMGYADDYITEENSVIVGRKGNINKPILMREKFWNVDTAFGLEPNTDILLVDYLYLYCLFFDFETLNKAVTIPSLTKSDLLNIDMPVPPIDLQNQFAEFVEQTDKLKFEVKQSLDELVTMKKALMQKYFG